MRSTPVTARLPDATSGAAIVVAVCAVSSSAPVVAFAAAPALAIGFWRTALAAGVLSPYALLRRRGELRAIIFGPARREGLFCALAGVALAAHFGAWLPAAKLTTAAAATALGATQPVWQGLIARAQGRRLSAVTWCGIALAVLGAIVATGADFEVSPRAVAGDLLAVAGGAGAAAYTAFGERARATTSTTSFTSICYAVCALLLGAVCLVAGVPMVGFTVTAWLAILGLTAGAQLLGHSMFMFALRRVPATTVSILVLLEVPGATLIAYLWLGQTARPAALGGLALLLGGVAVVVLGAARGAGSRATPATTASDASVG
ncbi:MAG TPA: DMT family transporter [Micromonosporaceae bacterium]|nr:DMT family transporter [Micromonosporaceae bacterium]